MIKIQDRVCPACKSNNIMESCKMQDNGIIVPIIDKYKDQ